MSDIDRSYVAYSAKRALRMRRQTLDCGCPNNRDVYSHILCDRLACKEHADDPHDCAAYGGAKDGTEEEAPEPAEAVPPRPLSLEMAAAVARQPRCDVCNVWVGSGEHRCARCVAAGRRVPGATSPWVSFADVAAGPVAGADSAVDVRRRVQDGTAPEPDLVTEVARAEFLRQGITEYEEDDVRWVYRRGAWQVVDQSHNVLCDCRGCLTMITDGTLRGLPPVEALRPEDARLTVTMRQAAFYPSREVRVMVDGEEVFRGVPEQWLADQPEPVSPHLDELEEPTYRRYECRHPGCEWVKVTLDLDVFDGLLTEHERKAHAPVRLPWWKRWTR